MLRSNIVEIKLKYQVTENQSLRPRKLAPAKAGIDNKKEILPASTLLNFKNLAAVKVIPARLTPGINAKI